MGKLTDYAFGVGKYFATKEAESPKEYLEVAEKIHIFLEQSKVETEDGIFWRDKANLLNLTGDSVDLAQYGGSSGALYFYINLYAITGKEKYKNLILKAADYLNIHWKEQIDIVRAGTFYMFGLEYGIYNGVGSIASVLVKVYELFGRPEDKKTIEDITDEVIASGKVIDDTVSWGEDKSPLIGGGVVLYLYRIYEFLKKPEILDAANKGADGILKDAIKDERGGLAWRSYAHPNQTRVPNFECGTAGVGFVLAVAYEISKEEKYLEAAKGAVDHLKAIAVQQGDGFLIPWHDNPNEDQIFYVSTCHGPAGTSRLFYELYKVTGEQKYLDDIEGLYQGMRHIGVPEKQSVGYWNTVGICCGTSGVAQFAINYHLLTKREDVKDIAKLTGSILLGWQEQQEGNGVAWPLAFERVKPQNLSRGISYAAGASGVGAALLQLYLFFEDKYEWRRLYDDPYPTK